MIIKQKLKVITLFSLAFVAINTAYFLIYAWFLYGSFSWLSLFYILIFSFSYSLILHSIRSHIWHGTWYSLLGLFYFWSLINFVYFQVFGTFLKFGVSYLSSFKGSFLGLGKDFLSQIPWQLLLIAIIFFLGNIILWMIYFKYIKVKLSDFNLSNTAALIVEKENHFSYAFILGLFLIILNIGGFSATSYLENHPDDSWWKVQSQQQDYGLVGHVYHQIFIALRSDSSVLAQSTELNVLHDMQYTYNKGGDTISIENSFNYEKSVGNKPNIINIQLESLGLWAVNNDPSPMPFLQNLIKENSTVETFYPNSCETINSEFSSLCSFWPNSLEPISYSHKENQYKCLPDILENRYNYDTSFFHSNLPNFWDRDVLTKKWGFENTYFTPFFRQKEADIDVWSKAIDILAAKYNESKNPFFSYMISFTTHSPHNQELIDYNKDTNNLIIQPFDGELNSEYKNVEIDDEVVRNYYGFLTATDNALQKFFEKLEESGLSNNTIVLIYNDHRYYNFENDGSDVEDSLKDFYKYNKSPFVMVMPNHYKKSVPHQLAKLASHIDIAPTILNLIEGDKYQKPKHFMGSSLLTQPSNQVFNKCLGNIFYINDEVLIQGNVVSGVYSKYNFLKLSDHSEQSYDWNSHVKELVQKSDNIIYSDQLVNTQTKK